MGKKSKIVCTILLFVVGMGGTTAYCQQANSKTYLVIRTDDAGMSHAVNLGLKQLLDRGYPITVSVMFPCPWYQEAVAILKEHEGENLSVGIHLTLNSEWQYYRWGPVAGSQAVPSLVNENGYFFHSASDLYNNNPQRDEVEKELRAQIERAMATGLEIDYMDYHMGTVSGNPVFMKIAEQLANEYDLALWGYFQTTRWDNHYWARPQDKIDSLVTSLDEMKPGYNHMITHVGIDNSELGAMKDMNTGSPLASMSAHRQAMLDALTSDAFAEALEDNNITLITYEDVIDAKGLENMKAPDRSGY